MNHKFKQLKIIFVNLSSSLAIACLSLLLFSCSDTKVKSDTNPYLFANELEEEFYKKINGGVRDVLAFNDYPIGSVLSVEIIVTPAFTEDNNFRFLLRSIIPENSISSYSPDVKWSKENTTLRENEIAILESRKEVLEHGNLVEVELIYRISKKGFDDGNDLLISDKLNTNLLVSSAEIKYLGLKAKEWIGRTGVFYVPVNL